MNYEWKSSSKFSWGTSFKEVRDSQPKTKKSNQGCSAIDHVSNQSKYFMSTLSFSQHLLEFPISHFPWEFLSKMVTLSSFFSKGTCAPLFRNPRVSQDSWASFGPGNAPRLLPTSNLVQEPSQIFQAEFNREPGSCAMRRHFAIEFPHNESIFIKQRKLGQNNQETSESWGIFHEKKERTKMEHTSVWKWLKWRILQRFWSFNF